MGLGSFGIPGVRKARKRFRSAGTRWRVGSDGLIGVARLRHFPWSSWTENGPVWPARRPQAHCSPTVFI
jgi:hypothetical protein